MCYFNSYLAYKSSFFFFFFNFPLLLARNPVRPVFIVSCYSFSLDVEVKIQQPICAFFKGDCFMFLGLLGDGFLVLFKVFQILILERSFPLVLHSEFLKQNTISTVTILLTGIVWKALCSFAGDVWPKEMKELKHDGKIRVLRCVKVRTKTKW